MVALKYEGQPLPATTGGLARLARAASLLLEVGEMVNGLQFTERNEAGFWSCEGTTCTCDPWHEQRYTND